MYLNLNENIYWNSSEMNVEWKEFEGYGWTYRNFLKLGYWFGKCWKYRETLACLFFFLELLIVNFKVYYVKIRLLREWTKFYKIIDFFELNDC